MSAAAAIAHASLRGSRHHLERVVGGRGAAIAVLAAVIAGIAGLGALSFAFYSTVLPGVFDATTVLPAAARSAQRVLVVAPSVSAALLATLFLIVLPAGSELRLAAQSAGASRDAAAIGEFVPMSIGLAFIAVAAVAGPYLYAASSTGLPWLTAVGLLLLSVAVTFAAATIALGVSAAAHRLAWPDATARLVGMVAALSALVVVLVDLLSGAVAGRQAVTSAVVGWMWSGRLLPTGPPAVAVTAVVAMVTVAAAVLASSGAASTSALGAPPRIVAAPRSGTLPRPIADVVRELVVAIRHAPSQLAIAMAVLLMVALVVLGRTVAAPPELIVLGCALLASSGAELAYGRTAGWQWVYRTAGVRALRRATTQLIASTLLGLPALVVAVTALGGRPGEVGGHLLTGITAFGALTALGYTAGVAVPFTPSAPLGVIVTATVAIIVETAQLWLTSAVLRSGSPASIAVDLAALALAVPASAAIVRLRDARG